MSVTDLVIIGSGPAGYTAAIYAARADIKTVLFEGFQVGMPGGQLMTTTMVENFPGFSDGILGPQLMEEMKKQAKKFSTTILLEDVEAVDLSTFPIIVQGKKTKLETKALIIATGATAKRLEIPGAGDLEFWQKGVSACAICDGAIPLFRNKVLFVIGGGDSAVEEALFLTKYASKVYIVHRRDVLKASKIMAERAADNAKIEILWDSEIVQILGDKTVTHVVIKNKVTQKEEKKEAAGVFFAIGHAPNTEFLKGQLELNENGYIIVEKGTTTTKIKGVFAAGDVQDYRYRQAITAAGSGCMAALDAERWLQEKRI